MKHRTRSVRRAMVGYGLIAPFSIGWIIFYAAPFISIIRSSLVKGNGVAQRFVGLDNYRILLTNKTYQLAFGNTMRFLAVALPLILVLSYAIALMLKNQVKKHQTLKSVLMLPYIMPVAGTVLLVDLIFAETGLLNKALLAIGLPITDWLHSPHAFGATIVLYLWKNTGYNVLLLLSGLVAIPEDHYAAAALDGASRFQQLRYITIPQMWYSVFFAAVFSLINAFKCFREIFLIGGTHPHESIYMLQHFLNNCFERLSYNKLAVSSISLMLVLTALFALAYRWVMKKEAYRA